jgi:hypothetical protein
MQLSQAWVTKQIKNNRNNKIQEQRTHPDCHQLIPLYTAFLAG